MFIVTSLLIFFFLSFKFLSDYIKKIRTGDPNESDLTYWMFSYDFRDNKDHKKYWDKDIQILNERKRIRNKLIFLLYVDTLILFILTNLIAAKMMIFIFD